MKKNRKGFTLAELLIVVAIIAVLVAIAIPIFTNQLEKSREATDLANVRSAYAEVMAAAIVNDTTAVSYTNGMYYKVVALQQEVDDWQTEKSLTVGGVAQTDAGHWFGIPGAGGSCTVYYAMENYTTAGGNAVAGGAALEWTGGTSGGGTSPAAAIAGLGQLLSRLGGGWGADANGLMSIGGASSAESASKVTLITTPIALAKGATVTIENADGYQTGYFLMKYDAEKGGYVKVVDSGWKSGTISFIVNEDGLFLATNTKKTSGNITVAEAETNTKITISGNEGAYSTAGMTATSFDKLSGMTSKAGSTMTNSTNSKTGGTISAGSSYYRGYAEVSASAGQILSIGANEGTRYAYYFVNKDNTVLFDSGWLSVGDETSLAVPEDCKVVIQVENKTKKMTDEALAEALEKVSIYSK